MDFWSKLAKSVAERDSLVCVGLDPSVGRIPAHYAGVADFTRAIIDQTADLACAYKPNIAFYEALGPAGLEALRETIAHVPEGIPVILDAKRNDIASTAAAYAQAVYEVWGADALTVNPYLGWDGIAPFLQYSDRGIFVLCKTSNPSSGQIQDWVQQGQPLYRHVAGLAAQWAGAGEIGLVVGATYPQELADLRRDAPQAWFLVPGVGVQGGDLEAVLQAGLRRDGSGVLINSSRGIMYADDPRVAAATLREQINAVRAGMRGQAGRGAGPSGADLRLARALYAAGCVQFGDFVLHSGAHAPIYVDLRRLVTYPRILAEVAAVYAGLLRALEYDRIAGVPYAALPIGTAVALQTGDPLIYPRREVKAHGTRRQIEGEFQAGERIVLLDDVISSGGSLQDALAPIEAAGLLVHDVVVLIDREQGGAANLAQAGYSLHAAITLRTLVDALVWDGQVSPEDGQRVHAYLAGLE